MFSFGLPSTNPAASVPFSFGEPVYDDAIMRAARGNTAPTKTVSAPVSPARSGFTLPSIGGDAGSMLGSVFSNVPYLFGTPTTDQPTIVTGPVDGGAGGLEQLSAMTADLIGAIEPTLASYTADRRGREVTTTATGSSSMLPILIIGGLGLAFVLMDR
ncbi:MAG: hypothetical protein AAF092_10555 [Pseudomonadota bacterium]